MLVIYTVEEVTHDGLLYTIIVGPSHPNTSQVMIKVELLPNLTSGEGLRVSTELNDKAIEWIFAEGKSLISNTGLTLYQGLVPNSALTPIFQIE